MSQPLFAMRSLLLTVLLLTATIGVAQATDADWTEYAPEGGGFRILLPATPKVTTSDQGTIVGKIHEHLATAQTDSGTFSIEYQTLPAAAVSLGGKERILNDAKAGLLDDANAGELSWTPESMPNATAMVLAYSGSGTKGGAKFVLVDDRLYVMDARGSNLSQEVIERFLGSFALE